jgi:hypothetical protein
MYNEHGESVSHEAPKVAFWMDTLCIPARRNMNDVRNMVISRMGEIYKQADKVLVLCEDMEYASSTAPAEEVMMRIALTSWWKRLWTLQEGVFAKCIVFQVSDGAVDAERLLLEMGGLPTNVFDLRTFIFTEVSGAIYTLRMFNVYSHCSKRIDYLMKALQWRSTSRAEDEPVCLATLLDLDVMDILNASGNRRMQKFVEMQKVFPRNVLFCRCKRLQLIGFRWVPVTWTSVYDAIDVDKETYTLAQYDDEGLYVKGPGFLFDIGMDSEDTGLKDENKICMVDLESGLIWIFLFCRWI